MKNVDSGQRQADSGAAVAPEELARALRDAGLDPSTAPDLSRPTREPDLSPQERVTALIAEHLANDLSDSEAEILAAAMWLRLDSDSTQRTKDAWRVCTFIVLHDVSPRALPAEILPSYMHTSGPSSVIHRWTNAAVWARAAGKLDALPYREWSRERREQLSKLVAWESQVRDKSERRKAAQLFKSTQPKEGRKRSR